MLSSVDCKVEKMAKSGQCSYGHAQYIMSNIVFESVSGPQINWIVTKVLGVACFFLPGSHAL